MNDLLLSVDVFHQEFIPEDKVRLFAEKAKDAGIFVRTQPAWLISRDDDNDYNEKTRTILRSFSNMGIPEKNGNIIFPEGNALKYLSEYFKDNAPINPYVEDNFDVRCLSFEPDGDVLGGNFYKEDIFDIIEKYDPLKK